MKRGKPLHFAAPSHMSSATPMAISGRKTVTRLVRLLTSNRSYDERQTENWLGLMNLRHPDPKLSGRGRTCRPRRHHVFGASFLSVRAQPDRNEIPEDHCLRGMRHDSGAFERCESSLLLSGLYRRPRSFTGSCAFALAGCYRRSGIGRLPSPCPESFTVYSIARNYTLADEVDL